MKHVEQYSGVWRLSEHSYKKFLKAIAAGEEYDLDVLGKQICQIDFNALAGDGPFEARGILREMK